MDAKVRKWPQVRSLLVALLVGVVSAGEWIEPRLQFSRGTENHYARFTEDMDSAEAEVFLEMVSNEHGQAEKATYEAVVNPRIVNQVIRLQTDAYRRQGLSPNLIDTYMEMVRQGSALLHSRYPRTWREQAAWEARMRHVHDRFARLNAAERQHIQWQSPEWYTLLAARKSVPVFLKRSATKRRTARRRHQRA